MSATSAPSYAVFAQALISARQTAGLKQQADLANLLKVEQQTISLWEAGTHRPSEKQLPMIAAALNLNVSDLRLLLGDDRPAGQSFTRPLPLESLAPDTFEQFVADLVHAEHPAANVRRAGKTGHKQDGLDVKATFFDGEEIDIQCKRVDSFGEALVKAAIGAYKGNAKRRAIALSRVASPAADTAARAGGWEMWDQDDLSRRLRQLPPEKQDRIVDTYFRGQRRELLGRDEPGPWRTTEEFFRPYTGKPVFNHDLPLIGREAELDDILLSLQSHGHNVTIIVAPGGMGKSRILKNALHEMQTLEPASTIRFLSGSTEASRSDLESLGAGSKILVIDDAHDRTGLAPIFEFAADTSRQTRLVIATRPYAMDRITGEAARFGLSAPRVVKLTALSTDRLTAITACALEAAGATEQWASAIVRASGRSPLIATMAARVVATQGIVPELAKNDAEFRRMVMGRFTDVLSANVAMQESREKVLRLLDLMALVQPLDPQSRHFLELAETFSLSNDEVSRAVRQLAEGGVLLQRGAEWRLMPDVLGDYLIEKSCVDINNDLSAFALQIVKALRHSNLLTNALLNLGRMDWRRNDGDTTASLLLDRVWMGFEDIESEYDNRLDSIASVAVYQPNQTLEFIIKAIHRGHIFPKFSEMLRSVVYSGRQSDVALELLWELGRNDSRETAPNPSHPIRILNDIAEYSPEKPLSLTKRIIDFAIALSADAKNWEGRYTPLDLMKSALTTEGHTTRSMARQIRMTPFCVSYDAVSEIRKSVIDCVLEMLNHPSLIVSVTAAKFLRQLILGPRGIFNTKPDIALIERLNTEFKNTLERIETIIKNGVRSEVFVAVLRAVDWHANYGTEPLKSIAKEIQQYTPDDIDYEMKLVLLNGHGLKFMHTDDVSTSLGNADAYLRATVAKFRQHHVSGQDRFSALERIMKSLVSAGESLSSAHMAVMTLLREDVALARIILENTLSKSATLVSRFTDRALWEIYEVDREEARQLSRRLLASPEPNLHLASALAFHKTKPVLDRDDIELLRDFLSHNNPDVVIATLRFVGDSSNLSENDKIEFLLKAELGDNSEVSDAFCACFVAPGRANVIISTDLAAKILAKLENLPKLDGHWIEVLIAKLSAEQPELTLNFLMRRVETAAAEQSYRIRPVNYGPYTHVSLRFSEHPDASMLFQRVWLWVKSRGSKDIYFREMAGNLFEAILGNDEASIVKLFMPLVHTAEIEDLNAIALLIRHADHQFVLNNVPFTIALLERCREHGLEILNDVIENLAAAALSGGRSGTSGEPMPRDVEDERISGDILSKLSRLSPAYRLYDIINKSAKRDIERSRLEGRRMDEMEQEDE